MVVHLDYGTEVDECEEALVCYDATSAACRWIIWRDTEKVWVQPLIWRPQEYDSVADAMSAPTPSFVQTDISITNHWSVGNTDSVSEASQSREI
jgi:hypothetical protein